MEQCLVLQVVFEKSDRFQFELHVKLRVLDWCKKIKFTFFVGVQPLHQISLKFIQEFWRWNPWMDGWMDGQT